ncbi:RNA 3'-terminal phosphate cyclase [Anaeromyxobacter diazotrophicus]|uniref:RNA 3'-terminal phosphate cyclase n=1 Tax=Anaeromyxobacter diazotrophicus TaxID=2590199 RepID=A0A7I9VN77_9BACT|nr:RNA 3'-terminal phosphate cyclase [Anaeromyxobacter diazotrophicus]GEJ57437.1 RNA 3'-terminal phosphate cyclase [Anaeromyxobacter diazotrophicus]
MPEPHIVLDGSAGEGGGQILRTALALSAITGRPFSIERVRANRLKPGLRPQHRAAALATAQLCGAEVEGAEVGSARIAFRPTARAAPGEHVLDLGTAGSAPLLFQTVCWPLALAGGRSHLTLRGGTHQQHSPTFHDLALVWAPAVARLGFRFDLSLQAAGFYPEGEGEMAAVVEPAHPMPPLDLRHRGTLDEVEVVAMVAGQPFATAERLAERALRRLRDIGVAADATRVPVPARRSAGSHLLLVAHFERARAGFGALGDRGDTPDRAADEVVAACARFLEAGAAVDPHLGDQLVLPAALVAAGLVPPPPGIVPATRYTVSEVTQHLLTTVEVVRRFLEVEAAVFGREGEEGEVRIEPPGGGVEVLPLSPAS